MLRVAGDPSSSVYDVRECPSSVLDMNGKVSDCMRAGSWRPLFDDVAKRHQNIREG